MDTLTAKEPGEVSAEALKEKAKRTGKKLKYYVISKRSGEVLIRYVTPKGNATNGNRRIYKLKEGVRRFQNYWHAYAYGLKLKAAKGE